MADFGGGELEAFRAEARDWIQANFPQSLKNNPDIAIAAMSGEKTNGDAELWRQRMGEKGWGVPTWPKAYGGGGLTPMQGRIVQQELGRAGAYNPIGGMGVIMFGPTLLEYGNEEQKQRHIPPIVRADLRWCQGFSEPGAGSDLAALSTKAEDKGDHFLVNGSKIWTSGAQNADWCFCLVRTDTTKKHEGISFVLIDMKTPGVEVRPIKLISGSSPFCETFFTDVKVPKENLVGPLNGGWSIAKRLLQHERSGISGGGGRGGGPSLLELLDKYVGRDAKGRVADAELRARVVRHEMESRAFQQTAARAFMEAKSNSGPSTTSSIMKNAGTWIAQERHELMLEIMGHQGLGWSGDGFDKFELETVGAWLYGKAYTIYGGSQEVQSNIVSKRILGLPDPIVH